MMSHNNKASSRSKQRDDNDGRKISSHGRRNEPKSLKSSYNMKDMMASMAASAEQYTSMETVPRDSSFPIYKEESDNNSPDNIDPRISFTSHNDNCSLVSSAKELILMEEHETSRLKAEKEADMLEHERNEQERILAERKSQEEKAEAERLERERLEVEEAAAAELAERLKQVRLEAKEVMKRRADEKARLNAEKERIEEARVLTDQLVHEEQAADLNRLKNERLEVKEAAEDTRLKPERLDAEESFEIEAKRLEKESINQERVLAEQTANLMLGPLLAVDNMILDDEESEFDREGAVDSNGRGVYRINHTPSDEADNRSRSHRRSYKSKRSCHNGSQSRSHGLLEEQAAEMHQLEQELEAEAEEVMETEQVEQELFEAEELEERQVDGISRLNAEKENDKLENEWIEQEGGLALSEENFKKDEVDACTAEAKRLEQVRLEQVSKDDPTPKQYKPQLIEHIPSYSTRSDSHNKSSSISQNTAATSPTSSTSISTPPFQDHLPQDLTMPIKTVIQSSGSSICSHLTTHLSDLLYSSANTGATQHFARISQHGWCVPLGVHRVVCSSPGLKVTPQLHRRSMPVNNKILRPGAYVEVLETQVHGERVRGRVCWEEKTTIEDGDAIADDEKKKKKSIRNHTPRLLKRKKKEKSLEVITMQEGWISLQKVNRQDNVDDDIDDESSNESANVGAEKDADKGPGPWTEPVPLGVYQIKFGGGLSLRESPYHSSAVLGNLDKGQYIEVVQTQVKGDRVRARICSFMDINNENHEGTSGWINLLNSISGSAGSSPVPLGAYIVVAEKGGIITQGGRLDSNIKGTLDQGSCMEVTATRIEEGTVRGLIEGGGYVTLFAQGQIYASPVPLGLYTIIHSGLYVTRTLPPTSSTLMKLQLMDSVEVIQTCVDNRIVRGRIVGVANEDGSSSSSSGTGWITMFEPNRQLFFVRRQRRA